MQTTQDSDSDPCAHDGTGGLGEPLQLRTRRAWRRLGEMCPKLLDVLKPDAIECLRSARYAASRGSTCPRRFQYFSQV